ncbi:chitinase 2-like [Salvia splendens]|nr:chitinase 2-like [Salvia splendens]
MPYLCIHTHTHHKNRRKIMLSKYALLFIFLPLHSLFFNLLTIGAAQPEKLFREYIGAEDTIVRFTDVPINPSVDFHFLLSFAIDYTDGAHPAPTNGDFRVYWDTKNLGSSQVSAIKAKHANVRVGMSLGGDTIGNNKPVYFHPTSIKSWLANAIHSITKIVTTYGLDGIDIDYEHFGSDPDTFAECIGGLIFYLKQNEIVSFTSIAPYEDDSVKPYYLALWRKYGHLIDYVNFQFYAYPRSTTVSQFLKYFDEQSFNYKGGQVLVSFGTDGSGGLSPQNGFFDACSELSKQGKLHGIFIWSADDSKKANFKYEKQSQDFLASQK